MKQCETCGSNQSNRWYKNKCHKCYMSEYNKRPETKIKAKVAMREYYLKNKKDPDKSYQRSLKQRKLKRAYLKKVSPEKLLKMIKEGSEKMKPYVCPVCKKDGTTAELHFLKESNKIEREYGDLAFVDAVKAWEWKQVKYHTEQPKEEEAYLNILEVHKLLMKNLNPKIAGKIREVPVMIGGEIKNQSKEQIKKELKKWCEKWDGVQIPEQIRKAHVEFEKIHPFEDGNGRTGRIIMNWQRVQAGLPILIIHEGKEQQEYYQWFREDLKKRIMKLKDVY